MFILNEIQLDKWKLLVADSQCFKILKICIKNENIIFEKDIENKKEKKLEDDEISQKQGMAQCPNPQTYI